jgi:acetyl-CoA synthetase
MTHVPDGAVPRLDAYHFYEDDWADYDDLSADFEWEVPDRFNIAAYICDRWADHDPDRTALYVEREDGPRECTYGDLRTRANRLANFLAEQGVGRGDRVGVSGTQKADVLVAHIAAWKLGAATVPLSGLYGPEGLRLRLGDSGATAMVAEDASIDALREIRGDLDDLETVVTVDADARDGETAIEDAVAGRSETHERVDTRSEETAMLIYTSGTTGPPKGVVHAHSLLLGILPGFVTARLNAELNPEDVVRTSAEWSWVGSFTNMVLPALYYGLAAVGHPRGSFDPAAELDVLERYDVSIMSGAPTVMRMLMDEDVSGRDVEAMRVVISGGESLGGSIVEWARNAFDAAVHEVYGQTEAPLFVGDCEALGVPHRQGKMGRPMPGHEVAVHDPDAGERVDRGDVGELVLAYGEDPLCFQEYWERPERTAEKGRDGWLYTEDLGRWAVEDGDDRYLAFRSRRDDVIISSGYRIGPEEVEEALAAHDAVADAGVIGVPDETRGQIPKAFVVPDDDVTASEDLVETLQDHVKDTLAKYEYPREIAFVEDLPTTTTGKVRRRDLREREGLE